MAIRLPDHPSRTDALTFISQAASYGNLGAFIGAGFTKAVLNEKKEVALSWGPLLQRAAEELNVNYESIDKAGMGYPAIASAICKAHTESTGCSYQTSLSRLKSAIAS